VPARSARQGHGEKAEKLAKKIWNPKIFVFGALRARALLARSARVMIGLLPKNCTRCCATS